MKQYPIIRLVWLRMTCNLGEPRLCCTGDQRIKTFVEDQANDVQCIALGQQAIYMSVGAERHAAVHVVNGIRQRIAGYAQLHALRIQKVDRLIDSNRRVVADHIFPNDVGTAIRTDTQETHATQSAGGC